MATQVEVSSALPSLAIPELRNEVTSLLTSLSHTGSKAGEQPGPLALLILEDRKQREALMRPAATSPAPLRARLTPKPFSREKTSDSFAMVKPPVPAPRLSSNLSKPSSFAQTFGEAVKGPAGNVPPLLDQSSSGHENPKEFVANVPFSSSAQANPVILFEGRSTEKARMEGTPGEAGGFPKAQEGQLLYSRLETSSRRPFSWNPLGKREACLSAPEGSAGNEDEQQSPTLASKMQLDLRERPGSGAFLEAWKGPTQPSLSTRKPACEKAWVQNPRPLSTDLTARFENQGREKSLSAQLVNAGPCVPGGTSAAPLAESPCGRGQTAPHPALSLAREVASLCQSPPEDPGQIPAKERRALWELQSQGSLNSEEGDAGAKELPARKGQAFGERAQVAPGSAADTLEVKNMSLGEGCTKKTFPVLAASAGAPAPAGSEVFPEGRAKESRMTNIQQRIKELTAENADFKPGNLGRSFRSRPLAADLTKLFSGPMTESDPKPQQPPQKDRRSDSELQEAQEDQAQPLRGTDSRKACLGSPWKSQLLVKTSSKEGPPEGESSTAKFSRLGASLQGEPPTLILSAEAKRRSVHPPEEACIKTVRATIFEHSIQRHHVVADHFAAEPPLPNEFPLAPSRGLCLDRVPGTAPSAKGSIQEANVEPEAPKPVTEEKASPAGAKGTAREKAEEAAPRPVEDSLLDQRIEPRYEILQAVGERVQSEAVTAVLEEKAVTLRRGRSLRERKRSGGGAAAVLQPWDFAGKRDGWRGDLKAAPETSPWKGLPATWSQHGSHRQELGLGSHWAACAKAASSSRTKESGQMDDRVSFETEPEERGAPAGRSKGAHLPDCFSEQAGVGPCRTGGSGSTVGQKITSSLASGSKSQWLGHTGLCSSVDPKPAYEPEEPHGCAQKTCSPTYEAEGTWDSSGYLAGGRQIQLLEAEKQQKRSLANGSAPRVLERWRRRTVPHEELQEPPQHLTRPVSRRESWHLSDCSAAQGSPQTRRGVDPWQAGAVSPSHLRKWPLTPSEPKATYFAVTYQVSNEIDKVPGKAAFGSPKISNARRADHSGLEGSPNRPPGWSRGGLSGKGTSEYPPREGAWELPGRQPGADGGQAVAADPPLCTASGSSSRVVHLRQDSRLAGQQRSSSSFLGEAEEQAAASYRSRAVDIDELMADYGMDSKKEYGKEDRKEQHGLEESSLFSGSPRSHFRSLRETSRREPSPGSRRPGTASGGTGSDRVRDGGPLPSSDWESGPWRARDGKLSPPRWARPEAEKSRPMGSKNRTSFPGQERGEPQRAKDAGSRPLAAHQVQMDLGPEVAPSSEGYLWKDMSLRRPTSPGQGQRTSRDLSGGTEGKAGVPRRAWEKASPVAQARAGQSSAVSGSLGAATTPVVKGSASDQALPKPGAPLEPEARLTPDWHPVHQSSMPARLEGQLSKDRRTAGSSSSPDRTGDLGRGRPKQDSSDSGARCAPSLLKQRRSHSFYRERRMDHWAGEQLKQCLACAPSEAGDPEVLLREAEGHSGTHSRESLAPESSSSESSPAPTQQQPPSSSSCSSTTGRVSAADRQGPVKGQRSTSPDGSSPDGDSADGLKASLPLGDCLDFAFLEQTPVLDSGALKSRVLLSKRRQPRAPSSRLLRRSPTGGADPVPEEASSPWMFKDFTEPKLTEGEDSCREERSVPAERLSSSQTPRRPVFPGVDPSALKAQLGKRRESEAGEEAPPAPLSKSPKGPLKAGVGGGRGQRATPEKGERSPEPRSPQWLQELKSRKKQSQAERPV